MNNAQINAKFLFSHRRSHKAAVLANIAKHYGITSAEAYAEVTDEEAEHLLEYVTWARTCRYQPLMKRHA